MKTVSNFPKPNKNQVESLNNFLAENKSFNTNYKWGFYSGGTVCIVIEDKEYKYNLEFSQLGELLKTSEQIF